MPERRMAGLILDQWQVAHLRPGPVRIFPDGCQDVIWAHLPGEAPVWKPAALDPQVRWLLGAEGASLRGFRLAPGCRMPAALWQALDPEKPDEVAAIARLRRAMADAGAGTALAEAAAGAGFADQAHFTREARHFHGAPPGRLLADPEAMAALLAPGL